MTPVDALARVMRRFGLSKSALARAIGCDETIVRDILARRRPLTPSRVAALPPRVRAAFEREIAAPAHQLPLF